MESAELVMVGRIVLAALLGLLIGLDRETHGRAAGMRTCLLVAMAGALLMSLSMHLATLYAGSAAYSVIRLDPGRLPSYAIAGMGFLGAGAIIQGRLSARGVTTGAAMWTCTAVGLCVGAGLYLPAAVTVALTLFALKGLRSVSRRMSRDQYVTLTVETADRQAIDHVRTLLNNVKAGILFAGRDRCLSAKRFTFTFKLQIHSGPGWSDFLDELEKTPHLLCYTWEESQVP